MNRLQEILERMTAIRTDLEALGAVEGELDEAQRSDWDALNTEYDTLDTERATLVARNDRLEVLRSANLTQEPGDGAAGAGGALQVIVKPEVENIYDLSRTDFFPGSREYAADVRDRAMRSIESWDSSFPAEVRESAEHVVRSSSESYKGQAATHILRTGNPDYVEGFKQIVANPHAGMLTLNDAQRAAVGDVMRAALNEGTTTQGGFLVPPMLDPTIILTNNGTINPFRQIANVKTINTQTWKGVTSAGVTAEWTAEAAQVADASPTFAQPSITPVRGDAYVQASMEMIQDTDIGMEVAMLLGEARDRLESTAFAVGTGSTQPKGIVTALQAVTASRVAGSSGAAGAADFVLADIYALAAALPPRHRPNSSWVGELTVLNKVRRFGEGSTANAAFWADLGVALPPLLLGRPVYQSAEMDSTIVSGSNDDVLILGDFKKYFIIDRIGLEIVYNPLVVGANQRPTGEVGWVAFWRTGADTVDANAFRYLRL